MGFFVFQHSTFGVHSGAHGLYRYTLPGDSWSPAAKEWGTRLIRFLQTHSLVVYLNTSSGPRSFRVSSLSFPILVHGLYVSLPLLDPENQLCDMVY